jgi:phosphate/phosphite/phosphonate ABC transporter binding protein
VAPERPARAECPVGATNPDRLRFAVARSGSSAFSEEGYRPVAAFLSRRLRMPVELVPAEHYADLWDLLARREAEVALLPPLAYVEATEAIPCLRPLATMAAHGVVWYSGYLLVHRDSRIPDVAALAGRKVAFVDRHSASGWLFPAARIAEAGVDPENGIEPRFLGEHIAVLRALASREVDAAASFGSAIEAARKLGVDVASLRVLAITGRVPLDAVAARPDLDADLVEHVRAAVLDLNATSAESREALSLLQGVDGFVATDDSLYDPVRETLRAARGLLRREP